MKKKNYPNIIELLLYGEVIPIKQKVVDTDNMSHNEFVVWFMHKHKAAINRYVTKRLIKNRYARSDVRAYIQERILDILQKRKAKGNPIEDPKLYFRKLLDYYCIEFQRMYGYIYCMPKRPRCAEAEEEIAQYGFVYLYTDDSNSMDSIKQLGYLDSEITNVACNEEYSIKGLDPDVDSTSWEKIMLMALPEQQEVLKCIFKYNMSVPEAARHLDISVSAAYQRKDRGLQAISGTLATFVDLDDDSWRILNNVNELKDDKIDITNLFL
jgi:hypothetical protein